MNSILRFAALAASASLSILLVIQLCLFHEHAVSVTWLYLRKAIRISSLQDEKKLGAICRSLGRSNCALNAAKIWVEKEPGNLEAIARLAMAYANSNQFAEAAQYFRVYFAGGGADHETTRSYASTLAKLGQLEESIPWYYETLAAEPSNRELAAELLGQLQRIGRVTEALSLRQQLASLGHLSPLAVVSRNVASLSEEASVADKAQAKANIHALERLTDNEIYFPSLDGRTFVLPVSVGERNVSFVSADPDQKKSKFNLADLSQWQIKFVRVGDDRARISQLRIGEVTVHDLEVATCSDCKSIVGSDALLKAEGRVDTRNRIAMLILNGDSQK